MQLSPESTKEQKDALSEALFQHANRMGTIGVAPEDIPEGFAVPTYSENFRPLYDNQLFPAVSTVEDLVKVGYVTPDGQSTPEGDMAIALRESGGLNEDYTLNDTGKAMMASREDLLKEEHLPLYMKSKELDLDGTGELSWGEVGSNFFNQLKEGGKNLIDLASFDTSSMTPEQQAEFQLKSQAAGSGFVKAGATLATGAAQIIGTGTVKALVDDEETQKTAQALLDQKVEKVSDDINNTNTAEFIDAIGEMSGVNLNLQEGREQAIALVGEEKAQEFERAGESAGGFAAMFNPYGPSMLTAKVAFGVAGKGLGAAFQPISRSLLQADAKAAEVLAKTKQLSTLQRQASGLQLATQAAEKQAATAESMAQKFSQAGFTDRANNALRLANQARTKGQEAAVRLGGFTDEIATVSDDIAKATQSATVADKVLQMTQKAGQIPYLPITLLGKSLEYTGRGMIGIDKGLSNLAAKVGADKAYNAMNKITTLSGLGGVGVASGLGPAAFIPAAIKATWSTAPFIKATGEYVGLMGKEAMKARGQIGFWKRMYEMPNKGPMHRAVSGLMDTATLGGRVTGAAGRVGKGLAASYPVDLAFEWVAEGGEMNPNVLKQAAVETLVFGGTGAALGGITMGSAERIRSLQNGDATNFYRSITDPSQRVMFNGMAPDMKRVIGTFSASNPGAKITFTNQGAGKYDRNTKTVMVNPNASNPLKPLLTHEFMHHMLNNGIGDGVVAQLVGDGYQTGGILRSKDGGYEQQYEAFKSEYVNRLRQQHERNIKLRDAIGDPVPKSERAFQVPDEKYLAEEYFIETNVDDMLGLVESGKLGKMAGRMVLNDKVRALGDAILNKSAILRDLHFRIGGVMDKQGKMVKGNGFLGGQLYQSPEIRRMFKKMVNESVGRRGGIDAAKMKARNGIELPISGKNDPILGELNSLWETDIDGNPLIDKNGDYVPLSKQTDELRSQAGMLLVDDLRARQARGEVIEDGELAYNPENNTWSGQYLTDRQIDLIALSGRFNNQQIKQLRLMNKAARATSDPNADPATRGHRFSVIYQPALKKNRKGQWRYDQIKPQMRDIVPYGVEISKDGNILYRIMSTNQLFANASEKAATKRGRSLYDGNMDSILRDANAIIDLHGKNQATDAYFKDKYGAQWASHKEFINSVFGNVGKGHKDINPLVASDRVDAVVKSYRLDRMNKATQLVGATQLPYQNNLIKINYLPEGEPILDANGEPKDLRYTPRYEERMPEQRQMPEVSPEDLNPVANNQEAQGLWADGKRMFALNEMDEKLTPITSKAMLDSYSADAIGWMEPEQAPAPSQRFMPEKLDADYMKAVESGDVETQQRMVDEAAKKAGYTSRQFHDTNGEFFVFDIARGSGIAGKGIYTTNKPFANDKYGVRRLNLLTKSDRVADFTSGDASISDMAQSFGLSRISDLRTLPEIKTWSGKLREKMLEAGYDAADLKGEDGAVYRVHYKDPSQIKSADPITRDDSGNIIPPSKRFDITSKDLRFMPEGVDEDKFYSQLDRVITDKVPTRATAAQIMATIDPTRGSGVKAEEIKWSGIEQALQSLEKDGKVSKEDLLNYLRNEGRVRFEEVKISEGRQAYEAERARLGEQMGRGEITSEEFRRLVDELDSKESQKQEPKYAQYQLPGGENYREVVLAMPGRKGKAQFEFKQKGNAWIVTRIGENTPVSSNDIWEIPEGSTGNNQRDRARKKAKDMNSEDVGSEYTSSHFPDIPNYVAHMRTNERVDADGRPGLFVEEFQSDRHQEGRKKGYREDNKEAQMLQEYLDAKGKKRIDLERELKTQYPEWKQQYSKFESFAKNKQSLIQDQQSGRVADAPFRTTWPIQLFKRALRDAVDSGKEWVGWTTGETQVERFDLSRQVDAVEIFKRDTGNWGVIATKNGNRVLSREATTTQLPDLIGKELAEKAVSEGGGTYKGDDLKVGGSGMKGFYDTMLPKEIGKYVKPFGGKVEKSEVATPSPTKRTDDLTDAELLQELNRKGDTVPIWKVSITPEMRKLAQGQMRFMPEKDADVKVVEIPDETTEQGTPAPDSDVQSLPLTGNPIPWDRMLSRQVRFMPESNRDAFPTMTPQLLAEIEKETPTLAAIHIDRMKVGEYMGIDLQGGMFYPTINENLDNGVVWAFNSTGVARTVANRAAQNGGYVKLVLMQEGNVVGNKTFANIWFKILSDAVDNKQISKGLALTELNASRRTVYKTLQGKDVKKNPWVTKHAEPWNSLDEAKEAILSMPQIERGATYFKKSKTITKSEGEKIAYQALLSQKMAKLGFPDARKIVSDIEEPAFKGIPTGAAVAILKFDPLGADEKIMTAKEAGVPEHMSYGYVLKGKPVAKLGYYQVVEETFPATKGQIMTQQHTDFPVRASVPSKKAARGEIQYASAIANAAKLK
jgi:hypothetical protein